MKKPLKIFITGGCGFIGSHLTEKLIEDGHRVVIYDNLQRNAIKYTSILDLPEVNFIQGDILDYEELNKAIQKVDLIIHLAAVAGVSNYYKYPAKTLRVNMIGTYNILELMLKNNINRLIDMSTSEIFGPEAYEVDESSYFKIGPPHDKRWSYAASKIGGEQMIYRYAEEYGWESTIVRPFNIYGPRQVGEGAVSNFCKNIIAQEDLKIEGNGSSIRSWCYISDFIDVLRLLINNPPKGVEAFNVGNPWSTISNVALAELVIKIAGENAIGKGNSKIAFVPMKFTEIKVRYPNISKIRQKFNWSPKISLEKGVLQTLTWFEQNYEKN